MDEEYCCVSPVGYMSQITKGGGYAVSSKKIKIKNTVIFLKYTTAWSPDPGWDIWIMTGQQTKTYCK